MTSALPRDDEYDSNMATGLARRDAAIPKRRLESAVHADAIALIKGRPYHGHARKTHGSVHSQRGEPDLDACVRGRAVKLEAKSLDGRPTMPQLKSMRTWAKAGALVGWFRDNRHVVQLLDHLDDPGFVPDLAHPGCVCPLHEGEARS